MCITMLENTYKSVTICQSTYIQTIINIQVCHNVLKYIHPDCNKYTSLSQCSRREGEGCRGGGGGHEGAGEVQLTDGGGRSSDSQHGLGKLSHHLRLN